MIPACVRRRTRRCSQQPPAQASAVAGLMFHGSVSFVPFLSAAAADLVSFGLTTHAMGTIKDIVDLAKDLESRAKDRRDMDIIHKIQSLAFSFQSSYADVVERDVRLMEENAQLKKQLAEAESEEIRFHRLIEFRRSKRTGGKWMAFCTKCGLPADGNRAIDGFLQVYCSGNCGWRVYPERTLEQLLEELGT